MKRIANRFVKITLLVAVIAVLVIGVFMMNACGGKKEKTLTVMSYNIRCLSLEDKNEKDWSVRRSLVESVIRQEDPDVIGFQEVVEMYEEDLKETMTEYTFNVAYRDEFLFHEGVAIAYKTEKFDLVNEGMFWLSLTPEVRSKDWGSNCYRVANYVVLSEKKTGDKITFICTHLDNEGDEARGKQMQVILDKMSEFAEGKTILVGDMNDFVGSEMYVKATNVLTDAYTVAKKIDEGTGATYQGYGTALDSKRIDYCFLTNETTVDEYKVDTSTFDGVYPSDHFPIIIKLVL